NVEIEPGEAESHKEAMIESYIEGLSEAGWRGEVRAVRFACLAYAALRWGWVFPGALALPCLLDETQHARAARQWQRPLAELSGRWAAAIYFLLDLADEARRLLASPVDS